MNRRCIAALLLGSLLWWSVPLVFAAKALLAQESAQAAQKSSPSSPAPAHKHDCCPGFHPAFSSPVFIKGPASLPCGDEHPCCVRPRPDNTPLPGSGVSQLDPGARVELLPDHVYQRPALVVADAFKSKSFPSYFERSTVLRF
jgi:hypothetical protein